MIDKLYTKIKEQLNKAYNAKRISSTVRVLLSCTLKPCSRLCRNRFSICAKCFQAALSRCGLAWMLLG